MTAQFEKLVKYYPKPEYWQNLVNTLFNDKKAPTSSCSTSCVSRRTLGP